ncbi:MAG: acyltransferase family protein [Bacteroidia bacterium]
MQKPLYFPNLNGLRFIAAFIVIIHHIEQFKNIFGLRSYWENYHIFILGKLGVTLFFVLSGFLITYLLLEEKKEFGFISIKEFYIRRILRIWPLYYFVTFLGFFVLSHIPFFNLPDVSPVGESSFIIKICLFLFMLPNICLAFFDPVPYASQLWSVGVEEQFYLFWPWMLNKTKYALRILIIIALLFFFCNFLSDILNYANNMAHILSEKRMAQVSSSIVSVFSMLRIGCMAIGGITAYILFSKNDRALSFLFSLPVQLLTYAALAGVYIKGIYLPQEGFSLLFAVIILNIAANPRSLLVLENKIFNFLGKISYGLYMLHSIGIVIAIKLVLSVSTTQNQNSTLAIYLISVLFTILLATLSYFYFEKRFLNLKGRFAKVQSTN